MKDNIADVEFNEDRHEYMYRGRRLLGITGAICDRLGKHYPEHLGSVAVQTSYGSQVHKDVERAINLARTLADIQKGVETEGADGLQKRCFPLLTACGRQTRAFRL
ncbi:MAG: hypothetical protein HDR54_03670 [Treponema sp.]|nr:hypothetical protein [Treponema sp.]